MRRLRKILLWLLILALSGYVLLCGAMYFGQESLLFHPKKLDRSNVFYFQHPFEEYFILSGTDTVHGLLFNADSSRGLVFYLHGNAGALDTWGEAHEFYVEQGYDFFILDYPGFGKSSGNIQSEEQIHASVEAAYDELCKYYRQVDITVIGYSIGSGPATRLASVKQPARLILQAPYYSITDLAIKEYPFIPEALLKYPLPTYQWIPQVKCPVHVFHGDVDEIIPYEHSKRLEKLFKKGDVLHTLQGAPHNGMNKLESYRAALREIFKPSDC